MKLRLRSGKNDWRPREGDTVHIHYVATVEESGVRFRSTREGKGAGVQQMKLGQHGNIRGLDAAVRTMNPGELSKFTCRPHFAYLEAGMTRQKFIFEVFSYIYSFLLAYLVSPTRIVCCLGGIAEMGFWRGFNWRVEDLPLCAERRRPE